MSHTPHYRTLLLPIMATIAVIVMQSEVRAQRPVHYQHRADMPPGAIGALQASRGGPWVAHFQPVEIRGPQGTLVSLAVDGNFAPAENNRTMAGMLIGEVYRLRIGNLPRLEGLEIYPSVEVIDRLYPPPGQETRFPIPIDLSLEDLEYVAAGKFVTRVIYIEDPRSALPVRELPNHEQRVVDSLRTEDPLKVADQYGRPVAILRIGSRVPDVDTTNGKFLFDSPPLQLYGEATPAVSRSAGLEARVDTKRR